MSNSSDHLLYGQDGYIARIVLNRPDSFNAFSVPLIRNWAKMLQKAQGDPSVRVVVITANGKNFCAGGDTKTILAGKGFIADDEKYECWGEKAIQKKAALSDHIHKIAFTLEGMDKPVICGINGAAVGAGLDMALMCDVRIAADDAKLSTGYVKVGLVPGDGGAFWMTRLVGVSRAMELLWTGDFISAQEAEKIGLVNKVVPAKELEKATLEFATKVANSPPVCVQMIKRAVYSAYRTHDMRTAMDMISSHMAIVAEMEDHREGIQATIEKRKPIFRGL